MLKSCKRRILLVLCVGVIMGALGRDSHPIKDAEVSKSLEPVKNLLVLGRDNASGLADFIAVAVIDTEKKEAVLLQIPRDTYAYLGEKSYKKLNGAYKVLGGEDKLCQFLGDSLGISIDGYISFDTALVCEVVDLLGGVELNVPFDMDYDDPYQNLSIHIKKGDQRLLGKDAVGFLRYRSGYLRADIGRLDAQKIFLAALAKTAVEKLDKSDMVSLARTALKYGKSDLSFPELSTLALSMRGCVTESLRLVTLPGEEVRSSESGAWFYLLSRSGCERLFDELGIEGEFDPKRLFTDERRAEFEAVYNKDIGYRVYSAAEIDGEGINITPK